MGKDSKAESETEEIEETKEERKWEKPRTAV